VTSIYLGIFTGSVVLSFVFTRCVRNWATSKGWALGPARERHLLGARLPRLGGIAIFAAFVTTLGLCLVVKCVFSSLHSIISLRILSTILLPGTLILLLGLYDDFQDARPYLKLTGQVFAGVMLFAGGLSISQLPLLFGTQSFPWWMGLPLTILWVVAISNAFNLIDGLDGLAAGSALFSTTVVFVVALFSQSAVVSLLALALAGAIVGFLRFNFNPATIFLGDCGSLFIGFMLSALALQGSQKAPTIIAVAIPVVSFGLPILEVALSVMRRFISGKPVCTADREHIHHKLLQRGLTHRQVVIALYGVSAVFALFSLSLLWPKGSMVILVVAVLATGIWVGICHLNYPEFSEIRRVARRTLEQRQIFANNLAIRKAMEQLKVVSDFLQIGRILIAAFNDNDFDAFDLELKRFQTERLIERDHGWPIVAGKALQWEKSGHCNGRDLGPVWSLRLDLITTRGYMLGTLTLYRRYRNRILQIDIDTLTLKFPTILADALDRTAAKNIEIIPQRLIADQFFASSGQIDLTGASPAA